MEALVLKEAFKVSLRYAENIMILCGRAQKSALSCWSHNRLVKDVLKAVFEMLRLVGYEYTVLESTNFTDWRRGAYEAFASIRVRLGEAIFPIHVEAATLEVEFTGPATGFALADGAFDAKPFLNHIAHKGYASQWLSLVR